jgi:hypothetical protein
MEPNVIPQWVHLGRLQAVGAEIAMDPQVMLEDRQKALKDLGRRGRHARDLMESGWIQKIIKKSWSRDGEGRILETSTRSTK